MRKSPLRLVFIMIVMGLSCGTVLAESYHALKVADLAFDERSKQLEQALAAPAVFHSGSAAATVRFTGESYCSGGRENGDLPQGNLEIVFRLEDGAVKKGFVDLRADEPGGQRRKVQGFAFTLDPAKSEVCSKEHFEQVRARHFEELANHHLPGTPWFKHRAGADGNSTAGPRERSGNELDETFGIFSGGRAISENLALDRDLILASGSDTAPVPLAEIKGVTVPAIDWSARLPAGKIDVDRLSLALPEDQHAVFATNLPELLALVEQVETGIMPGTQAYSVRNPFRLLASRYRAQLGLDLPAITARLLPAKGVAITGGDPFFPQGTDLAIVFESDAAGLLYQALLKTIEAKAAAAKAGPVALAVENPDYRGFQTADRTFSSYIRRIGEHVVVANSPRQIERLLEVQENRRPALGATDEFRFFRSRYPLGQAETAFVFLSDATIRRWAGPELRIAASRRTRAVAALGKLTSRAIAGEPLGDEFTPLLGGTRWQDGRVLSEKFGSLQFLTPASELAITTASAPERDAYVRWLNGYENGWAQAFDPIAIRINRDGKSLGFDLSVLPLTVDSDFRTLVELCGAAKLGPMARWVPEEAVMHLAMAFDTKSPAFQAFDRQLIEILPGVEVNPLSWMSGAVSLGLDDSLLWQGEAGNWTDFGTLWQIPAVMRVGSRNPLKLGLFMTALRTTVETSAPGAVQWETRKQGEKSYVMVSGEGGDPGERMKIYYATLPKALLVSLDEDALLRAMGREGHKLTAAENAALGAEGQLLLDSSPGFLQRLGGLVKFQGDEHPLQTESWKALPILNEWHRLMPEADPLKQLQLHYGTDVFCPGGKGYRWNEAALTMESVAFGHPAAPREDGLKLPGIGDFASVGTVLEFQDGGLRAKVSLGPVPQRLATPPDPRSAVKPVLFGTAAEFTPLVEGLELSYKGTSKAGAEAMLTRVKSVTTADGATRIESTTDWTDAEGEKTVSTSINRLQGALVLEETRYEDGAKIYRQPFTELPEKLVAGEVTRLTSSGRLISREEGIERDEAHRGASEIRVLGKEDVVVPAGAFAGCVRIAVRNQTWDAGHFSTEKYHMWYHPTAGLVRYQFMTGDEGVMELVGIRRPGE